MEDQLIRTNVFLSAAQRDGFKKLARKQGTSAASLIRRVLDAYLGITAASVGPITFKNKPPAR
jgi:hypothetical protein